MEKYTIADFCFMRTPAYPVDLLYQLYQKKDQRQESISAELKKIYADPSIQTALHGSSSRAFYAEFRKWMEGTKSAKENEKIEDTLIRYLARMTTRCVPFGMFSGFSVADIGNETNFQLVGAGKNTTHLRLDMEYIQDIVYTLCADEKIKRSVSYYRNSSIYRVNDKFKYVEYSTDTYLRKYNYAAVAYEEYLDGILQAAAKGCSYSKLIEVLKDYDDEISDEDAAEYVNQLIAAQLLVSELEPNITGKDNLTQIIEILNRCEGNEEYTTILEEIQSYLKTKRYDIERTEHTRDLAEKIVGAKPYWSILQTDMEMLTRQNKISRRVLETIAAQMQQLEIFAYGIDRPALRTFKQEFLARYDTQEIPLVEAIDPDIGIGYGNLGVNTENPLLKDIAFGNDDKGEPVRITYDALTDYVTEKYIECIQNGSQKLIISDEDLKQLKEKGIDRKLPDNFFMHGSLVAASPDELDNGNFLFHLKNLSGPPSCLTLGRFCYTSEYLTEKVKDCIAKEEALNKEAIYAEIVHLTNARVGNVTIRPHLRAYEIPYLGKSGLNVEYQIPVTDLMVSVRNNSIRLRSKRLNREIIPRLTNAHVFAESYLPVYKFLGECQRDRGSDWLSWHWQYLKNQRFLPRVQYKNIVLKTAKWLITRKELPAAPDEILNNDPVNCLRQLAEQLSIPRFVSFFEELDKEFIFDLHCEISCRYILKELNRNGSILLEEYLQPRDHCWISDTNNQRYANEIMLPVNKITTEETRTVDLPPVLPAKIERKFSIGSEWLYFKLYTSRINAENMLMQHVYDLIRHLQQEDSIVSWHFLRYGDPEYHLRLRFHSNDNAGYLKIMEGFTHAMRSLQDQQILYKIQIDTYDREVERYGPHTMEESEQLFCIDSAACLEFIRLGEEYDEYNERWLWALKAIDMLLHSFGYALHDKQRLLAEMEQYELKRSNGNKSTIKQANAKYKLFEKEIKNLLAKNCNYGQLTEYLQAGMPALDERYEKLQKIAPVIMGKVSTYGEVQLDSLTASYIHMFINRLFVSNPNKCEFVIYTLLNRYYLTAIRSKAEKV
ncbi:lantibiotic dehydratase [Longitalea luteola]|uniref:lantibiotic dehydratase n=1 Tax=Longitalea luteola TaxID=2812563 RepID=UPI001A960F3C|nr:lantibiotic dehydratase [Longitalea luteola]